MTSTEVPTQYGFLFRLLREFSEEYSDQLEKLWMDNGRAWNQRTARFEVDAYFVFRLSSSLLGHKQERQVWEDMYYLCEAALVEIHKEHVLSDNLANVIVARITEYGDIANHCGESHDAFVRTLTERLRHRIMISSHDDHVEESPPFVLCDIYKELDLRYWHLRIDWSIAGAFDCALKHVFQRTNDVRTLSEEEFRSLVEAGQKEAIPLGKKNDRITEVVTSGTPCQARITQS